MIPYGKQEINQADIDAVISSLKSDFLTQGRKVSEFENKVASYCSAKHAVAVNSATSGLHIACLALGVGSGDYVWTTPITFWLVLTVLFIVELKLILSILTQKLTI